MFLKPHHIRGVAAALSPQQRAIRTLHFMYFQPHNKERGKCRKKEEKTEAGKKKERKNEEDEKQEQKRTSVDIVSFCV